MARPINYDETIRVRVTAETRERLAYESLLMGENRALGGVVRMAIDDWLSAQAQKRADDQPHGTHGEATKAKAKGKA